MIKQAGRNLRLFHVPDFGKKVSGGIRNGNLNVILK